MSVIDFLKKYINLSPYKNGIVGINKRNIDYILKYNPRKFYPMVDDKLITKDLAVSAGIPAPALLDKVEYHSQVDALFRRLNYQDGFVIKPSKGAGGGGILVITKCHNDHFYKAEGKPLDKQQVKHHIFNILAGMYSLGGKSDTAMVEERIICHEMFAKISYKGVPDIRIIVFQGYPVMAMLRLPTQQSDGKANLHSGGIGVGLSIRTGQTTFAVQGTNYITHHPDYETQLFGIQIPEWEKTLTIAAQFKEIIPLGYLGIDLVVDQHKGASLLEANARPGISIQIANRNGLQKRLAFIEDYVLRTGGHKTPAERARFAMDNFYADNEKLLLESNIVPTV